LIENVEVFIKAKKRLGWEVNGMAKDDIPEMFGRLEGVVILKYKSESFLVTSLEGHGTVNKEEQFLLNALDETNRER